MASQESLSSDEADEQSALMINPPPVSPEYSENPLPGEDQQPREQFLSASGARPQAWRPQDDNNMVAGQTPTMIVAPPPDYPGPHDFLILALVTMMLCAFLNLVSLAFGIPATILAAMSLRAKHSKNYPKARKYGRNALILTVLNIMFTLCIALAMIGWITEGACISGNYYGQNDCEYFLTGT